MILCRSTPAQFIIFYVIPFYTVFSLILSPQQGLVGKMSIFWKFIYYSMDKISAPTFEPSPILPASLSILQEDSGNPIILEKSHHASFFLVQLLSFGKHPCLHVLKVFQTSRVVIWRPVMRGPHRLTNEQTHCFDVVLWSKRYALGGSLHQSWGTGGALPWLNSSSCSMKW